MSKRARQQRILASLACIGSICGLSLSSMLGCSLYPTGFKKLPSCNSRVVNGSLTQQATIPIPYSAVKVYLPDGTRIKRVMETNDDAPQIQVLIRKTVSNFGHSPGFDARELFDDLGVEYCVSDKEIVIREFGTWSCPPHLNIPICFTNELCVELPNSVEVEFVEDVREEGTTVTQPDEAWTLPVWSPISQREFESTYSDCQGLEADESE